MTKVAQIENKRTNLDFWFNFFQDIYVWINASFLSSHHPRWKNLATYATAKKTDDNGPIFLQTIPIPAQAQRVLILYFCFFFKLIRHIMCMIKTCIIKIHSGNLIHYHKLLAMIPKNKDPWQNHPIKNDSGSNILSLNRDRDRLQKYWAIVNFRCSSAPKCIFCLRKLVWMLIILLIPDIATKFIFILQIWTLLTNLFFFISRWRSLLTAFFLAYQTVLVLIMISFQKILYFQKSPMNQCY